MAWEAELQKKVQALTSKQIMDAMSRHLDLSAMTFMKGAISRKRSRSPKRARGGERCLGAPPRRLHSPFRPESDQPLFGNFARSPRNAASASLVRPRAFSAVPWSWRTGIGQSGGSM